MNTLKTDFYFLTYVSSRTAISASCPKQSSLTISNFSFNFPAVSHLILHLALV